MSDIHTPTEVTVNGLRQVRDAFGTFTVLHIVIGAKRDDGRLTICTTSVPKRGPMGERASEYDPLGSAFIDFALTREQVESLHRQLGNWLETSLV